MQRQSIGLMSKLKGLATAISRLPSFLIGLLIICVLVSGAYAAWRVFSKCSGQSLATCLWSSINPIPASYGRGAGEPLRCTADEDMDGGARRRFRTRFCCFAFAFGCG